MIGLYQTDFTPNTHLSASGEFICSESAKFRDARNAFTNFGHRVPMTSSMSRLVNDPVLARLNVGPLEHMELPEFYRLVKAQVGTNVASFDQVEWVHTHNPQSLLVIRGENEPQNGQTRILGLVALLFLTEAGEKAVRQGYFTSRELKEEWLATDGKAHRAIYTWAIAANGQPGRYKLARLVHFLSLDVFGELNQYGFAATEAGEFFLMKLGFQAARRVLPNVRAGTFFKSGQPAQQRVDFLIQPNTTPLEQ